MRIPSAGCRTIQRRLNRLADEATLDPFLDVAILVLGDNHAAGVPVALWRSRRARVQADADCPEPRLLRISDHAVEDTLDTERALVVRRFLAQSLVLSGSLSRCQRSRTLAARLPAQVDALRLHEAHKVRMALRRFSKRNRTSQNLVRLRVD
jgi:hypothetical protein